MKAPIVFRFGKVNYIVAKVNYIVAKQAAPPFVGALCCGSEISAALGYMRVAGLYFQNISVGNNSHDFMVLNLH